MTMSLHFHFFKTSIACHKKIAQQTENFKNDSYAGVDAGSCVCYFLWCVDKPSLKTAVMICKSQDSYIVNFYACTSYLKTIVLNSAAVKQVDNVAVASEVKDIKPKNRMSQTVISLMQSIQDVSTRCSPQSRKNGSSKTARKPRLMRTYILAAKKWDQSSTKQAIHLSSVVQSHLSKINCLTTQNQKIMETLFSSRIDIGESNPSSKDEGKDHKMAANK